MRKPRAAILQFVRTATRTAGAAVFAMLIVVGGVVHADAQSTQNNNRTQQGEEQRRADARVTVATQGQGSGAESAAATESLRESLARANSSRPGRYFQTESDARRQAENMGFSVLRGERVQGAQVYQRGREFIARDMDGHNGGAWKMANSLQSLRRRETRRGTYNHDLSVRVGD
jgi:head-tail adaptor